MNVNLVNLSSSICPNMQRPMKIGLLLTMRHVKRPEKKLARNKRRRSLAVSIYGTRLVTQSALQLKGSLNSVQQLPTM